MNETTTSTQSSLTKYYRRPKLSVKLPTNGLWYSSDIVELNENAMIEILPMSGLDEIKAQNPELLSDNKFKFEIIKSCCPKVKIPEKMMSVDIDTLMFGIFAASYGNSYKSHIVCPCCQKKYDSIESEEERKRLMDNKELSIQEQEFVIPANTVLDRINVCCTTDIFFEYNGLKIYLRPISIAVVDEYNSTLFYQQMLEKSIEEISELVNSGEKEKEEAIKEIQAEVKGYSDKMYDIVFLMLVKSISYIEIEETGEKITSEKEITDFLKNSPYEVVDKIRILRDDKFDILGLPKTMKVECPYCHNLIETPIVLFNPTSFFGSAS